MKLPGSLDRDMLLQMLKTNRRRFLATTGAGIMLPALFPHPLGAQSAVSYAPFIQQQFNGLIGVASESYFQAYIRDPSNTGSIKQQCFCKLG